MLDSSNPIARRRLILITITLATIPCYCLGGFAILFAPVPAGPATPTATWTATEPLQILTSSPDPSIFTATPSDTPTTTVTPSPTNTPTSTLTPSATGTWTSTPTPTATFTSSATFTPSITFTPSETFTPSPTLTPITPSVTPTASITSFPTTP